MKLLNNKKALIIVVVLAITTLICIFAFRKNRIDILRANHAITSNDTVFTYNKNKSIIIPKGTYIHILMDNFLNDTYTIMYDNTLGSINKNDVSRFNFNGVEKYSLMIDVSEFNKVDTFKSSGDFELFVINNNINYVYIRLGGRGYGEQGNFYYDKCSNDYINACEFLGIPYGFYYLDEALNEEEIAEEVSFVKTFLSENKTNMNVLPLAIDIEYQDGKGRADSIWNTRYSLINKLIDSFKIEGISCIVYANAKRANDFLNDINASLWVARYPQNDILPNSFFPEFIKSLQNEKIFDELLDENGKLKSNLNKNKEYKYTYSDEFLNKIVGWQFSESGAKIDGISEKIDLSIVLNKMFYGKK